MDTGFQQMWIFVADFGFPYQEVTILPGGCGGVVKPAELYQRHGDRQGSHYHSQTEGEEALH